SRAWPICMESSFSVKNSSSRLVENNARSSFAVVINLSPFPSSGWPALTPFAAASAAALAPPAGPAGPDASRDDHQILHQVPRPLRSDPANIPVVRRVWLGPQKFEQCHLVGADQVVLLGRQRLRPRHIHN